MADDSAPFYLVRLSLDAPRMFTGTSWYGAADTGYLAHCQLVGLFGDLAPKPFVVSEGKGRHVEVLGYSRVSTAELRDHALAFADPKFTSACDLERMADKPMPSTLWRTGRRVGFDVRVCPVHRKAKGGEKHGRGKEVDVFLSRCWEAGAPISVDRESVYREWLETRLSEGGTKLVEAGMIRFRRTQLLRRTQGEERTAKRVERPDALFHGTLEIADPDAFAAMLARGVGRHRAFGFGMLLLRPPKGLC
jgi:CRISPR system Cascade subunit CasE